MNNKPIYQALAEAFAAEGVDTQVVSPSTRRGVGRGHGKM